MDLIYGAGRLDRRITGAEELMQQWRVREADWGQLYLDFKPSTPGDVLQVEDLAVTMLINSRVAGQAAAAILRNGPSLDLASMADKPLELATSDERDDLAELIGRMTSWPWIGASLATKTLHKKRPHLVPILDNQAIFGAYMNPRWPERRSSTDTVKTTARIREARHCEEPAMIPIIYDLAEAARILGFSESYLRSKLRDRTFAGMKRAGRWAMTEAQIEAAIESMCIDARPADPPSPSGLSRHSRYGRRLRQHGA